MDRSYEVRRSSRRTLALELDREGKLIVRATRFVTDGQIRRFVARQEDWIRRAEERQARRQAAHPEPTEEERKELIRRAKAVLPGKVEHYAALLGVRPTRITVTGARTRFGSCSAKNALSFSWRLMEYPEEAIDYVVVHELAHIRHHDHSPAFYAVIESVMPDHRQRRALLRK
ncbi:MAG: M48 family metallopeptidase [Oscillospiraceae bacterium]|nr:M48 family metallopeptidase [Oscillospiraceae bacterium]